MRAYRDGVDVRICDYCFVVLPHSSAPGHIEGRELHACAEHRLALGRGEKPRSFPTRAVVGQAPGVGSRA